MRVSSTSPFAQIMLAFSLALAAEVVLIQVEASVLSDNRHQPSIVPQVDLPCSICTQDKGDWDPVIVRVAMIYIL